MSLCKNLPAGRRRYETAPRESESWTLGSCPAKLVAMNATREPLQPIFTAHLFPELEAKLLELLRSLTPEDWEKQTLAPKWMVKDVAAHLLDTQTRKLAAARHGYKPENSKKLSSATHRLDQSPQCRGGPAVPPTEPGRIDFKNGFSIARKR